MFNIVCVTHRKLCENFFKRVGELYENNVPVILREKDLSESEYEELAKKVIEICPNVILHSYINVAKKIGVKRIHLPLRLVNENVAKEFETVGVSVHSAEEAVLAEKNGADYLGVGAVFHTGTKKDANSISHETVKQICEAVNIPVIAIGGISRENVIELQGTGICGIAVVSAIFAAKNITEATKELKELTKNMIQSCEADR